MYYCAKFGRFRSNGMALLKGVPKLGDAETPLSSVVAEMNP